MQTQDTALLIFAQPPAREGRRKVLVSHRQANEGCLHWLNGHTLSTAKKSGLPYFITDKQLGNTFGERMSNALKDIFQKGFQHVIAIGNDCPELLSQDLTMAALSLQNGQAVLGPDHRNGAYLIGLTKKQFDLQAFAQLPWQNRDTFRSLFDLLHQPTLLPKKQDLNDHRDLKKHLHRQTGGIRRIFLSFVRSIFKKYKPSFKIKTPLHHEVMARRGPPIYSPSI